MDGYLECRDKVKNNIDYEELNPIILPEDYNNEEVDLSKMIKS